MSVLTQGGCGSYQPTAGDRLLDADPMPLGTHIGCMAAEAGGCEDEGEDASTRFLDRYGASYHFDPIITYKDGARSNFVFTDYEDASFAWRFPDLTNQVVFTARLIEHTIRTLIVDETHKLITFSRAQRRLKDVLEMPDQDAARIIRSVFQNNWSVSGKLRKAYPALSDSELASSVVQAIRSVMDDESDDGQSP